MSFAFPMKIDSCHGRVRDGHEDARIQGPYSHLADSMPRVWKRNWKCQSHYELHKDDGCRCVCDLASRLVGRWPSSRRRFCRRNSAAVACQRHPRYVYIARSLVLLLVSRYANSSTWPETSEILKDYSRLATISHMRFWGVRFRLAYFL